MRRLVRVQLLFVLRLAYGALLNSILFLPFGVYRTISEPYVSGALWGFILPAGYVAAVSGVTVLHYSRLSLLRRLGFVILLILVGVSILASVLLFPRELPIILLHRTNMIDMDFSVFDGSIVWRSIFSIGAGIALKGNKSSRKE